MTKKIVCAIIVLVAAFVLAVNCIPRLAAAASDVPVLGAIVRVVTFGRFEVSEENYEAEVTAPQIEGLSNQALADKLNKELSENADAIIAAFEADVKKLGDRYGDKNFYLSVTADYAVKTDTEDILAVDVFLTTTEASAATTHRFYTIDKKSGTLVTLESLFQAGADYVTPISEYLRAEMKRQNDAGTGSYAVDEFTTIGPDQNFYLNAAGNLVICFDEYEVASGAQGSPEFEIPDAVISDIVK